MKTMKKVFLVLLSAALMLSMAGAVGADGDVTNGGLTGDTPTPTAVPTENEKTYNDVYVNITETTQTFTVQIPSSLNLYKDASQTVSTWLNISKVQIPQNKTLNAAVNSTNAWKVVNSTSGNVLPYNMTTTVYHNSSTLTAEAKEFKTGHNFNAVYTATNPEKKYFLIRTVNLTDAVWDTVDTTYFNTTLKFQLGQSMKYTGSYSDTLSFYFAVVPKPTPSEP